MSPFRTQSGRRFHLEESYNRHLQFVLPCRTASSSAPSKTFSNCSANAATAAYSVRNRIVALFCKSSSGAVQTGEVGVVRLDADPEVALFETGPLSIPEASTSLIPEAAFDRRRICFRQREGSKVGKESLLVAAKPRRSLRGESAGFHSRDDFARPVFIRSVDDPQFCCDHSAMRSRDSGTPTRYISRRRRDGLTRISSCLTSSLPCRLLAPNGHAGAG
jgi:hypothetical protein